MASDAQANAIIAFVNMQVLAIHGGNKDKNNKICVLYQLPKYHDTYIGRCILHRDSRNIGGGLTHRFKEHIKLYWGHMNNTVTKAQRRSRYFIFGKSPSTHFPTIIAIHTTTAARGPALEAAYISYYLPSANNIEKTFGTHCADETGNSKIHNLHKQACNRLRATTKAKVLQKFAAQQETPSFPLTHHLVYNQIAGKMITYEKCVKIHNDNLRKLELYRLPLGEFYRRKRSEQCGEGSGPANIYYDHEMLTKIGAVKPYLVDWSIAIGKKEHKDYAYRLWSESAYLSNYHVKVKLQSALIKYAETTTMPIRKNPVLVIQSGEHSRTSQKWFKNMLTHYKIDYPWWYKFYAEKTKIISKGDEHWRKRIINVQRTLKSYDVSSLLHDRSRMDYCRSWFGCDMLQIPQNLNVPFIPDDSENWQSTIQQCKRWASRVGIPNGFMHLASSYIPTRHLRQQHDHIDLNYQLCQLKEQQGPVWTPQDKDISIAWAHEADGLVIRFLQLLRNSGRWSIACASNEDVVQHDRKWLNQSFPANLIKSTKTAFNIDNVPHIYPTVKEKCYKSVRLKVGTDYDNGIAQGDKYGNHLRQNSDAIFQAAYKKLARTHKIQS